MGRKLQLNRSLGNTSFGGWKLDSDSVLQHSHHQLAGRVQVPSPGGSGFLQTKMVVTYNHLHQLQSGIYTFLADGDSEEPCVYRLKYVDSGTHGIASYLVAGAYLMPVGHWVT